MARLWFHPPVVVMTEKPGLSMGISSVERAGEQLLQWSVRGPNWEAAVAACMAALDGTGTPEQAREAFAEAARESGMLLGE